MKKLLLTSIIALCSYTGLHAQSTSTNSQIPHSKNQSVNISDVKYCVDSVNRTVEYKTDKEVHGVDELWQSNKETKKLGTGDCEDKSEAVQRCLCYKNIYSELAGGKLQVSDDSDHAWVQYISNDTTFILEATSEYELLYRDGPGIKGNIGKNSYVLWNSNDELDRLDSLINNYKSRNGDTLIFVNQKIIPPKVNMVLVKQLIDATNKITYVEDLDSLDHWQSPLETSRLNSGDSEDKAIYLQSRMQVFKIDSRLVYGNYDSNDKRRIWLEWDSSDTTYIYDPKKESLVYKTQRGVKGISRNNYKKLPWDDYLEYSIILYYERNQDRLRFKNIRNK
ncbi:MAG TPA: hypothetical protein VEC16_06950 [Alphaproteobacteria bacterium]|nr:hypothetical protein [Alphaproteobacteria bacterium]